MRTIHLSALLVLLSAGPADAKVARYLTGNAADVDPRLHGPALDRGGGSTDVDAAFQWLIDEVRGRSNCDTKPDVVALRATGADGVLSANPY